MHHTLKGIFIEVKRSFTITIILTKVTNQGIPPEPTKPTKPTNVIIYADKLKGGIHESN
jgi:hypothetical protein